MMNNSSSQVSSKYRGERNREILHLHTCFYWYWKFYLFRYEMTKLLEEPMKVGDIEIKLTAFADDSTFFARDKQSFNRILNIMKTFGTFSSLNASIEKCEVCWTDQPRFRKDRPVKCKLTSLVTLVTFNSYCGRFHFTLDYIFLPNCLLSSIKLAKTFDDDVDNTSDHLPIKLKLCYTVSDSVSKCDEGVREGSKDSRSKLKIHWSKFPSETINRMYKSLLLFDLEKISMSRFTDSAAAVDKIKELLMVLSSETPRVLPPPPAPFGIE